MYTYKRTIEAKDLPKPVTEEERREQWALKIAMLLAQRIDGRKWQRHPDANQAKFQSSMLRLAHDILASEPKPLDLT